MFSIYLNEIISLFLNFAERFVFRNKLPFEKYQDRNFPFKTNETIRG